MANIISAILTEAATIALTITADKIELEAGQPVSLPRVQVGTVNGKPLYLEAVLSTT